MTCDVCMVDYINFTYLLALFGVHYCIILLKLKT